MRPLFSVLTFFLLTLPNLLFSQSDSWPRWLEKKEDFKFRITAMTQVWSYYSMNHEVWNSDAQRYEAVDDRVNFTLRRARLVFRGEPYKRLKFTAMLYYDHVGRDLLGAGIGGVNEDQPNIGLWDAFLQYQLRKKDEAFVLTAGYFRPQMQRESITSGWSTTSFEKSMSQNYVRRHLVGTGPGRATGLNLGGLLKGEQLHLNYNVGIFNPITTGDNSVGTRFSPLLAGRAVLSIGDPEMEHYRIAYETNYYSKRKGLSLDFNGSWQGSTDLFETSWAFGPGLLLNWGALNIDGEWIFMTREGTRLQDGNDDLRRFDYRSNAAHLRVGYNLRLGRFLLEPTAMIMQFNGGLQAEEQADAQAVGAFSGEERAYDVGFNLYLNKRHFKIMLHYTWREGDPGNAGEGARVNQYFSQSGVGAIRRGNYLGLGVNTIF